jgi:type II secretory pathway component PulF
MKGVPPEHTKFKKGQERKSKRATKVRTRDIKEVLKDLLSQEKNGTQLIDGLNVGSSQQGAQRRFKGGRHAFIL